MQAKASKTSAVGRYQASMVRAYAALLEKKCQFKADQPGSGARDLNRVLTVPNSV